MLLSGDCVVPSEVMTYARWLAEAARKKSRFKASGVRMKSPLPSSGLRQTDDNNTPDYKHY